MKLYVLGAGTPTPIKDRFGTSFVLQVGDDYLMMARIYNGEIIFAEELMILNLT